MKSARKFLTAVAAVSFLLLPAIVLAQGTLEDYRRADQLRSRVSDLLYNSVVNANSGWVFTSNSFWYHRVSRDRKEFVLIDADERSRQPAFDHERLAESLSEAAGEEYTADDLPFTRITFIREGGAIKFIVADWEWTCDLNTYECTKGERVERGGRRRPEQEQAGERVVKSPDGKWDAYIRDSNLYIRSVESEEEHRLSYNGSPGEYYASIVWSPDSKKVVSNLTRPGYERLIHYVESSPDDQLQPRHSTRVYAKPGDALTIRKPTLFHVETQEMIEVDDGLFSEQYSISRVLWRKDSRAFTFEYNQRGHQVYRIIEVDADSGNARALIEERSETFIDYSGKKYRHDVDDGKEIIWASERDGWNHLYLYDGIRGEVKNQITRGEWVVRRVDRVDEEARQITFQASGREEGHDPYLIHYYRINFDGTGLIRLTAGNGNHSARFSNSREYFVDTWSRVDLPPTSVLRRSSDGREVMMLEEADIEELLQSGWQMPEVFCARGRDGETDIWGIICRPMNMDESRRYPVIEYIYAGPHSSHVPKTFRPYYSMQALAELGFIVVQIDGMGTSNRSKAFHDVCWRDIGDAGFPDRILWHRAVANQYPFYDISGGVGIYGTSAGGQSSMGALLFHPEFYTVAVSACGCHDNRMDKIWWNEQWMGYPIGPWYETSSNMVNAHNLQGKLFLIVGEMDSNVDPSSTMQVVNALIEAGKDFDLLVLPGGGHSDGGRYGERRRRDFFVRHLLGMEPPDWNAMER